MSKSLTVLVTGATGQQGGATARALLARGHRVRALTRKRDSAAAQALEQLGAELAVGGFDDAESLKRALSGVDAAFIVSTPFEAGTDTETRQGIAAIDAAKAAGVQHIVFTSVSNADKHTGIPHFESKARVEEHLARAGVPYTILGPVFFQENLTSPWWLPGLKDKGVLAMPMPATRVLQQIGVEEIGAFAALVFERREAFLGKRVDLASNELTPAQAVEILSRAAGRSFSYFEVPLEAARASNEDFALMFEWFDKVGYSADIAALRRDFPEVPWRSFEQWAQAQDWKALLGA